VKSLSLVPYLVKKYLRFDKSQPFITISALLAFLGVSIGLMVLIIAMAIMNGTSKEFKSKISTMSYPITILPKADKGIDVYGLTALKEKFPHLNFSPYINSQVIVKQGNTMEGAALFGVNFEDEAKINSIIKKAVKDKNISKFEIITGQGIADSFALLEGAKTTLVFTQSQPGGFSLIPTMKRFTYRGSFKSGMQAYDQAYIYTTIEALSRILKIKDNRYDGIHVHSDTPVEEIKNIRAFLPENLVAVGWWQQNGNLFSAMEMEKKHFL
jgi:putative ABC transport system permease protein